MAHEDLLCIISEMALQRFFISHELNDLCVRVRIDARYVSDTQHARDQYMYALRSLWEEIMGRRYTHAGTVAESHDGCMLDKGL